MTNFIEEALLEPLLADASVAAKLGGRIHSRFPVNSDEPTVYPLAVYTRISTPRIETHDNQSDLKNPRVQFTVFSDDNDSPLEAKDAAQAMIDVLRTYSNKSGTPRIDKVFIEGPLDLPFEADTRLWSTTFDTRTWTNAD